MPITGFIGSPPRYPPETLPDFTLQQLLLRLIAIAVIAAIHGVAMTVTAGLLGDHGPDHDGRTSANPARHLDAIGTACLLLWSIGWIKPIRIERASLPHPVRDTLLVVVAGLSSVLVLAIGLGFVAPLVTSIMPSEIGYGVQAWIDTCARLAVWFALANLVPIPPFTGGYILMAFKPTWHRWLDRNGVWVRVAMAVVVAAGLATHLLADIHARALSLLP